MLRPNARMYFDFINVRIAIKKAVFKQRDKIRREVIDKRMPVQCTRLSWESFNSITLQHYEDVIYLIQWGFLMN